MEYAPFNPDGAWIFGFGSGDQLGYFKGSTLYAMAVRPGDVTAAQVPEPGTLVLVIAALASLGVVRRRRAVGVLRL